MFRAIYWSLFIVSSIQAQEPSVQDLSQRFTSTLKDTWVESKLTQAPKIKDCIDKNKVVESDLEKAGAVQKKQDSAMECFKNILGTNPSEEDLKNFSKALATGDLELTDGRNTKKMTDYLTQRLQKALYGTDGTLLSGLKNKKLKDIHLVDQKVFVDLVEMQLGKNIVMEITRYCYRDLSNKNCDQASEEKEDASSPKEKITTQIQLILSSQTPASDCGVNMKLNSTKDLFENLDPSLLDPEKNKAENITAQCLNHMKNLCDIYKKDQKKTGERSCLVMNNLRALYNNLNIIASDGYKKKWADLQGGASFDQVTTGMSLYNESEQGKTHDDLTAITSKDVESIYGQDKEDQEFERLCRDTPEDPKCDKYFFSKKDSVILENARTKNQLAIELEVQKIDKITERKDLVTYLKDRGHEDIAKKCETDPEQCRQDYKDALEAEKTAAFEQLAASFERKQIKPNDPDKLKKAENYLTEIKNQKNQLSELVSFNNIVMSYLDICYGPLDVNNKCPDKDKSRFTSAGNREVEGLTGEMVSDSKFLQTYKADLNANKGKQGKPTGFIGILKSGLFNNQP